MKYFSLCADGNLVCLGDHDTYESADIAAETLGLEVVWLVCKDQALQWFKVIGEID